MPENEQLLTLGQLSDYLGVSYNTVLRLKRDTDMPRVKLGKVCMYRPSSITRWLDDLETKESVIASGKK